MGLGLVQLFGWNDFREIKLLHMTFWWVSLVPVKVIPFGKIPGWKGNFYVLDFGVFLTFMLMVIFQWWRRGCEDRGLRVNDIVIINHIDTHIRQIDFVLFHTHSHTHFHWFLVSTRKGLCFILGLQHYMEMF